MTATPEQVFAVVGDLKRLPEWSDWPRLDPSIKVEVKGEPGLGQSAHWASPNPNVGVGNQTVTAFSPPHQITSDFDLGEMGKATTFWHIQSTDTGTRVTYGIAMKLNTVMDRWAGLMMDRAIGTEYEDALRKVKQLAEQTATPAPK